MLVLYPPLREAAIGQSQKQGSVCSSTTQPVPDPPRPAVGVWTVLKPRAEPRGSFPLRDGHSASSSWRKVTPSFGQGTWQSYYRSDPMKYDHALHGAKRDPNAPPLNTCRGSAVSYTALLLPLRHPPSHCHHNNNKYLQKITIS